MDITNLKLQFIIDGKIESKIYTLDEILCEGLSYDQIIEDMEECNCALNESTNHCEGDCLRYENSVVTSVNIL